MHKETSLSWFRIIGDVHLIPESPDAGDRDDVDCYLTLAREAEYSLQIGDMSIQSYDFLNVLNPERHKVIFGNHDNYDLFNDCKHNLGDFGVYTIPEFGDLFFVRGEWSIDRKLRQKFDTYSRGQIIKKNIWDEEEMSMAQCQACLDLYKQVKPKLVVSHGCPLSVVPHVTDPGVARSWGWEDVIKTRTAQLLQALTEIHRPKMHIFGHYHRMFDQELEGTRYVCVDIMRAFDLPKNFVETL